MQAFVRRLEREKNFQKVRPDFNQNACGERFAAHSKNPSKFYISFNSKQLPGAFCFEMGSIPSPRGSVSREAAMALKDVLIDELRDMYSAENQLVKALPKLAKGAKNPELKSFCRAS
jgi:hypothetical protein